MKLLGLLHLLPNILRDPDISQGESFIDTFMSGMELLIGKIVSFFTSLFEAVVNVIYVNGDLTVIGWLLILGLGFGAFWFVFRWIRSLIKFK